MSALLHDFFSSQTIIAGWRQASKVALQALENSALSHVEDEVKFREDLMNIARTTISSKILSQHKDFFAKLAVDAVLRLKGSGNLDAIQIIKIPGGRLDESFLDSGGYILRTFSPKTEYICCFLKSLFAEGAS